VAAIKEMISDVRMMVDGNSGITVAPVISIVWVSWDR